jgi:uncharacterized SAM-binding protein YcdF (DUF218 family)
VALLVTVATALAAPLTMAAALGLLGLLMRLLRRRRIGNVALLLAASIAWLGATAPVAELLLAPLERRFPRLPPAGPIPAVRYVVVLGSGYEPRDGIPISAALDEDGLVRIIEGLRLARSLDHPRLVLSGGAPLGRIPVAQGYAVLAHAFGIADASMVVLGSSLNTAAEAQAVGQVVGTEPFLLVTSAFHMPRAMLLMQRAALNPVAAPTGQRLGSGVGDWRGMLPNSGNLRSCERAMHEYLALAALRLGLQ